MAYVGQHRAPRDVLEEAVISHRRNRLLFSDTLPYVGHSQVPICTTGAYWRDITPSPTVRAAATERISAARRRALHARGDKYRTKNIAQMRIHGYNRGDTQPCALHGWRDEYLPGGYA
jgi:hypothetical protein